MKTREEIITDMCYTWRHDYGLDKGQDEYSLLGSGMTDRERRILWDNMAALYDKCIAPYVVIKSE